MCKLSVAALGVVAPTLVLERAASASAWPVSVTTATGAAQSQGPPAAPANPAALCLSALSSRIVITWSSVAFGTTYAIYASTTSSSSGYSSLATGIAATTYTTAALPTATYWFKITASTGTKWEGPMSGATSQRTIVAVTCV